MTGPSTDPMTDTAGPSVPSDSVWTPQHIVCSGDEKTIAFVVDATRAGDTAQAGLWSGDGEGVTSKLTDEVPTSNLALWDGLEGNRAQTLLYAVINDGKGECVLRDFATGSEIQIGR